MANAGSEPASGRAAWKDDPVEVDRGWRFVSIGYEGQQSDVAGVNPWEVEMDRVPAPLDEGLIGYWSDEPLYQGAMEAADIAFRPDGTGWTNWSRDGGTFHVYRFSWHTPASDQLTLALGQELSGTWDVQSHTTRYHVQSQTSCSRQIELAYQIRPGQDALEEPTKLLQLDKPIRLGVIGDRFAFMRELAEDEQGPTAHTP
jgi:hypothetical protein